jgi:hypothetical protein
VAAYDESKYLAPKFSTALKDLAVHYGIFEKTMDNRPQSISSNTSNVSYQHFQQNFSVIHPIQEYKDYKNKNGYDYFLPLLDFE